MLGKHFCYLYLFYYKYSIYVSYILYISGYSVYVIFFNFPFNMEEVNKLFINFWQNINVL